MQKNWYYNERAGVVFHAPYDVELTRKITEDEARDYYLEGKPVIQLDSKGAQLQQLAAREAGHAS